MSSHSPAVAHHFENADQQRQAAELGMWLFLITEFMFFGGLFLAYLVFRWWYPAEFAAGSETMSVPLGTVNTAALLTSSLTMALAVHAAGRSERLRVVALLAATAALGCVFLGIKAYEYHHKYEDGLIPFMGEGLTDNALAKLSRRARGVSPPMTSPDNGSLSGDSHPPLATARTVNRQGLVAFFNLYFLMTGLHAFHMVIGIVAVTTLIIGAWRGGFLGPRSIVVHNVGLYWHFVDLVWVFLFPFFYLVAVRGGQLGGH